MQLVDTHCHIHDDDYPLAIDDVMIRAADQGVAQLICVGTDQTSSQQAVEFVQDKPSCWASIGLHPHDAKAGDSTFAALAALMQHPGAQKIVAVGECGLDYFYNNSPPHDQEKMLRAQIELALEHKLPMIFHVREAFNDFWPIFDNYQGIRGVVHSFTDSQKNLEALLARGLYVGVNGIATFTKQDDQKEMFKKIPIERLVLETDAPFLTPVPKRGTMNEPANVWLVAKFLAELRGQAIEDLARTTTQNAQKLFSLNA